MAWTVRAVALWCAVVLALLTTAAAYTVDCNHEYTDCDTELSKMTTDEEEVSQHQPSHLTIPPFIFTTTQQPKKIFTETPTTTTTVTTSAKSTVVTPTTDSKIDLDTTEMTDLTDSILKAKPRLLDLSVDELQSFANALHNQTNQGINRKLSDISEVSLDVDEDDEPPRLITSVPKNKDITDKFYSNLQVPFNPLLSIDKSDEVEICKENEIIYKVGDRIDRGCDETCECTTSGIFECSPRCKHPYTRRGRRLNDPLCFESPVDECCSIIACSTGTGATKADACKFKNESYAVGSSWNIGCQQTCVCEEHSVVSCRPRCNRLQTSEKCINVQDPNDDCCEIQVCDVSSDAHEEPENITMSTTTTTPSTTTPMTTTPVATTSTMISSFLASETGRSLDDQNDSFRPTIRPLVLTEPIGSVTVLQNNSVQVNLMHMNNSEDPIHLLLSSDGGRTFRDVELRYTNLILNLEGGKDYILKTKETGTKFNFTITASDSTSNEVPVEESNAYKIGCHHDGQFYAVGEEFHIGCSELCECTGDEKRECAALVCPSHVGLELVSKGCVRWAANPPAHPPNCCPRTARCLSDGTCHYKGVAVPNWSEVPLTLTGCEQRCFCENGELDCQEVCSPLPSLPPQTLRCPPNHRPAAVNISDEDCCKQWGCIPNGPMPGFPGKPHPPEFIPTIPPEVRYPQEDIVDYEQNNIHRPLNLDPTIAGIPMPPSYSDDNKKLSVILLQSDTPTSVKMIFGLPPVLVGLRGSVDLRYTDTADEDISHWYSQIFAPADEILGTQRLDFRLTGLKPSTTYKIRGKLYLHNLPVEPESDVFNVRTLDLPVVQAEEEKRREINSRLTVVEVNDTTARLSWRHFTDDELQYIDGIQVRYRPVGTPIYSMTEVLHHARAQAELSALRPAARYEAELVLIPPPRALTELYDATKVEFTTSPYVDPYNWTVTVEVHTVGSVAAELMWHGVPAPAERWVRIYRAAHACGSSRKEHDDFRLATRDLPPTVTLNGLTPNSKCRVWLELYLTNGKVKTSNVVEIHTKSENSPETVDNIIEASSVSGGRGGPPRGDYYGALVAVGVVAALGALTSLLLLLVVVRRHRPRSVPITPVPSAPRESSLPPYDNPAYKLELQQETMGNGNYKFSM
ncbi:PREDICTED: putative epidermal cell surface receptor isoform X4 [Papilio xuthus]|uniref:Epidermal cell surface receptor isoform X4 n=1 Tax=Papilio xuthus TaxID=66420 RepID=A0AAJ7EBU6_PAPXU|nr:PREDICTED: putative epidermal cell surface receptor isoform X4 [Papilio xuthus]